MLRRRRGRRRASTQLQLQLQLGRQPKRRRRRREAELHGGFPRVEACLDGRSRHAASCPHDRGGGGCGADAYGPAAPVLGVFLPHNLGVVLQEV